MRVRLSARQWFRIVLALQRVFREAGAEVAKAHEPDSEGGQKITRHEALAIVGAALAEAVEPIADVILDPQG